MVEQYFFECKYLSMETLITLVVFLAGFITGALVTRKNLAHVNKVVEEAKEFAKSVDDKIDEIRESQKKPATKRGRKPVAKK